MTHTAQILTDVVVYVEIYLGKKMAKEKYIIQLNSVLFINITKDLQYYILPDMHEMLPSYEYRLEEKYIAPYFT